MKMMRRATALLALAVVAALLASAAAETVSDADDVDAAGGVDAEARRPKLVKYRVTSCQALASTIETVNGVMANATADQRVKIELACRRSSFTDCNRTMVFSWKAAASPPPSLELEITAQYGCRNGKSRPALSAVDGFGNSFFFVGIGAQLGGGAGFALTMRGLRFPAAGTNGVLFLQSSSASQFGKRTATLWDVDVFNGSANAAMVQFQDDVKVKQCRFESFSASSNAPLLIQEPQGSALVEQTVFKNITGTDGGLSFGSSQGNMSLPQVTVRSCTFENCATSSSFGNAATLRFSNNATLIMTGNKFINNGAGGFPAVCFQDQAIPITDPVVTSRGNRGLGPFGVPPTQQACSYIAMQE